jgi:hypothetical protein
MSKQPSTRTLVAFMLTVGLRSHEPYGSFVPRLVDATRARFDGLTWPQFEKALAAYFRSPQLPPTTQAIMQRDWATEALQEAFAEVFAQAIIDGEVVDLGGGNYLDRKRGKTFRL